MNNRFTCEGIPGKTIWDSQINNIKVESDKNSMQYGTKSYFRIERNLEKVTDNQNTKNNDVKGMEQYLKSHSKQLRSIVKLAEVKPWIMNGVSLIKQSKWNVLYFRS